MSHISTYAVIDLHTHIDPTALSHIVTFYCDIHTRAFKTSIASFRVLIVTGQFKQEFIYTFQLDFRVYFVLLQAEELPFIMSEVTDFYV